jgi:hypothetical protein
MYFLRGDLGEVMENEGVGEGKRLIFLVVWLKIENYQVYL